jgi:hypothetical protein
MKQSANEMFDLNEGKNYPCFFELHGERRDASQKFLKNMSLWIYGAELISIFAATNSCKRCGNAIKLSQKMVVFLFIEGVL